MDVNGLNGATNGEPSARAVFHEEVFRQREKSGWSLSELSARANYDTSYLQRLEKGDRLGTLQAVAILDRVYDTGKLLVGLWRLAKQEARQKRFPGFMELSAKATSVQQFSAHTVPGLLQTRAYAEAQLRTGDLETEELLIEQLAARLALQERLTAPRPVNYRVLLDESVIRRPTQEPEMWDEQLEHLIRIASQANVRVQVVPFRVGLHNLLGGSMTLLWLPDGRNVAYVESAWSGQIVDETEEVERLRVNYDQLRDSAMSPSESLQLLRTVLEDHRHAHPRIDPERPQVA
ncbi:helix-turn-helix domain-containing protein [Actinacidiphila yeochonensis]|uniref:helix-turn-helix domain-containing protein n=1 Tax=Actinacidiphila yeochonensis TaxID=89050 RepID=UPI0007C819EB|nr:helix-turn-helix transcriptional regulator [Actinacidiphila yeochonensis]